MTNSTITLRQILFGSDLLDDFGCCKLIINDEVIWDDDVDCYKYVRFTDALERFFATHSDWESYRVTDINIQIVHLHHSIVSVRYEKRK